jgi:hypothetical protein
MVPEEEWDLLALLDKEERRVNEAIKVNLELLCMG